MDKDNKHKKEEDKQDGAGGKDCGGNKDNNEPNEMPSIH